MPWDVQAPLRLKSLGDLMGERQDRQLKDAQIQAYMKKAQGLDLDTAAESAAYKAAAGQPLSPSDNAAIQAFSALKGGQTFFDPNTGQMMQRPDLATNLMNKGFLQNKPINQVSPNTISAMTDLPTDLAQMDNNFNAPGAMGNMPPPANLGGLPPVTMGQLREKAAPIKVQGPLAGTPKGDYLETQANLDLQKQQAEQANKPMDQNQGNAALFADRMVNANSILDSLDNVQIDPKQNIASRIPGGNFLVSPDFQKADQAQRDFINATLRKESGAAISPGEFDNARKQYFPQPGDSAEVIAQKKQNRQIAIQGIGRQAGPNYSLPQSEQPKVDYKSKYGLD